MTAKQEIIDKALQFMGIAINDYLTIEISKIYDVVRDAELAAHYWPFAIKTAKLQDPVALPSSSPKFVFRLPDDCLRIISPKNYEMISVDLICIDNIESVDITYHARVEDESLYPAVFTEVFAARLATELTKFVVNYRHYDTEEKRQEFKHLAEEMAWGAYRMAMNRAKFWGDIAINPNHDRCHDIEGATP